MKTLIILATLIAIPALADVEFTLIPDRIEMDVTETVTNVGEETATKAKKERAEADQARAGVTGEKHRPETNPTRQTEGGITAEDDWMAPSARKEVIDGKTNRRSAEDHNSSRSNFRKGDRLDDDTDGDGISDVRRCNAKDNDCDDDVVEKSTRTKTK